VLREDSQRTKTTLLFGLPQIDISSPNTVAEETLESILYHRRLHLRTRLGILHRTRGNAVHYKTDASDYAKLYSPKHRFGTSSSFRSNRCCSSSYL
jgi:hypothetical protein